MDEKHAAAEGFAFGYCTCLLKNGKKFEKFTPCDFGTEFVLDEDGCVKPRP